MKIYIDLSFTKISGQYIMHKALKDEVIARGMYAEKEDCDVAVYVQASFDKSLDEFKALKAAGKKIVFIHHYFSNFEHYAIFTVPRLLELVDLNLCIAEDSDLYKYLVKRGCKPIVYEQVAVDYNYITYNYFKSASLKDNSICFVGRANKGLDDFIDYIETNSLDKTNKIGIFCATDKEDVEIEVKKLGIEKGYAVAVNKSGDMLWKDMTNYKYLYMNADMMAGKNHLETVMHEAMAMGVIVILGPNQRRYITASDDETGFLQPDFFKQNNADKISDCQTKQLRYLTANFIDKAAMMDKNIKTIENFMKSAK